MHPMGYVELVDLCATLRPKRSWPCRNVAWVTLTEKETGKMEGKNGYIGTTSWMIILLRGSGVQENYVMILLTCP